MRASAFNSLSSTLKSTGKRARKSFTAASAQAGCFCPIATIEIFIRPPQPLLGTQAVRRPGALRLFLPAIDAGAEDLSRTDLSPQISSRL